MVFKAIKNAAGRLGTSAYNASGRLATSAYNATKETAKDKLFVQELQSSLQNVFNKSKK